VTQNMKSFWFS